MVRKVSAGMAQVFGYFKKALAHETNGEIRDRDLVLLDTIKKAQRLHALDIDGNEKVYDESIRKLTPAVWKPTVYSPWDD